MKAAVCYQFGQPLRVEDIDIEPPQDGEVQVRIAAVAICHSDVHVIRGEWGGAPPVVAGHEAAGIVEQVGANVRQVQVGDHVVVSLIRSCGHCFYCASGLPHQCEGSFALNTQTRLRGHDGTPIQQGLNTAAFAESVIVDQSQVVSVPNQIALDRAALLACGVITGVGAVVNITRVQPGCSVAVIGCGGVGLNVVQGASLSGAYPIIALDTLDAKLTAAHTFGATHTVNSRHEGVKQTVEALTNGRGADYVFVAVGNTAAVEQGFSLARREGTVALVGIPAAGATAALPVADVVIAGKRIVGCLMGATRLGVDVPRLVELYQHGRLKLDQLITARYPLEAINEAIEAVERGAALRNLIVLSPDMLE